MKDLQTRIRRKAVETKRHLNPTLETGFSMLEAVVVVGVLLALAVGGFLAYGAITDNARKAIVKTDASKLHTASLVAHTDSETDTSAQGVLDAYNSTADQTKAEFLDGDLNTVEGTFSPNLDQDFCVKVSYKEDPSTYSINGACTTHVLSVPGGGGGGPQIDTISCGTSTLAGYKPLTSNNAYISSSMLNYMNCQLLQSYSPDLLYWLYNPSIYEATDVFKNLVSTTVGNAANIDVENFQSSIASDLNTKYENALYGGFYAAQTPESQIAAADAQREMYQYIIANASKQPNRMVAAPSHPENFFSSVTVAAGTMDPIRITSAVPSNLENKYGMAFWQIWEDYNRTGPSSGVSVNTIDGAYQSWDFVLTPNENWDKNKVYTGSTRFTDKAGQIYTHTFEIKVQ